MMNKSRNRSSLQVSNSFSFSKTFNNQPTQNGPYRATKLWQKSIDMFVSGVPLGSHRSGSFPWKTYESTFKASEAITWFHRTLQTEFDPSITRPQTFLLLQKFYSAGVFIAIGSNEDPSASNTHKDQGEFKDNFWQIYKLGDAANLCSKKSQSLTKVQKETTPKTWKPSTGSSSRSKNYTVVINPLSIEEIHQIWWDCFLQRLVGVAGAEILDMCPTFLSGSYGQWISYNIENIGNYGVVILKPEHLAPPTWLISAMKCLVGWPNSKADNPFFCPEETSPHDTSAYPNFENDVFRLVTNYFQSYELINPELYELFIACFIRAEMFDFNRRISSNLRVFTPQRRKTSERNEAYPFPHSESTDNLIVDILTPARSSCSKPRRILQHDLSANTNTTSLPSPMSVCSYNLDKYCSSYYYETAFTDVNTPITRVVSHTELRSTMPRRVLNLSTPAIASDFAYENPTLTLSPGDLINHPRYERVLAGLKTNESNCSYREFYEDSLIRKCQSAVDVRENPGVRSPYNSSKPLRNPHVGGGGGGGGLDFYYGAGACVPGLITYEGKSLAIECFRLLTLLLPASKRRHLQLLLRFMIKVSRNDRLMLDVGANNRTIMINTFYRSIFSTSKGEDFDELLALRIVTFMMDNDQIIFDLTEEIDDGLYTMAMECIKRIQIQKVPVPSPKKTKRANKENNVNYCSKISMAEYEDQRLLGETSKSLRNLLEAIVTNDKMEEKAKKKTLRKFEKEYPHIYAEKFGNANKKGSVSLDNVGKKSDLTESTQSANPTKRKPFSILKTLGL